MERAGGQGVLSEPVSCEERWSSVQKQQCEMSYEHHQYPGPGGATRRRPSSARKGREESWDVCNTRLTVSGPAEITRVFFSRWLQPSFPADGVLHGVSVGSHLYLLSHLLLEDLRAKFKARL